MARRTIPVAERLARYSERTPSGCLVWTAGTTPSGYGVVGNPGGGTRRAHRAAWEVAYGPVPAGMEVCHRCDNRRCIAVEHLFLGTHLDNMRDMAIKGRARRQNTTHCINGHELTPENVYSYPRADRRDGQATRRMCRTCHRASSARSAQKRKAVAA